MRHRRVPEAQSALNKPEGGVLYFSGEALYAGPDIGTVARTILQQERN
jgi:hypothetical protein